MKKKKLLKKLNNCRNENANLWVKLRARDARINACERSIVQKDIAIRRLECGSREKQLQCQVEEQRGTIESLDRVIAGLRREIAPKDKVISDYGVRVRKLEEEKEYYRTECNEKIKANARIITGYEKVLDTLKTEYGIHDKCRCPGCGCRLGHCSCADR